MKINKRLPFVVIYFSFLTTAFVFQSIPPVLPILSKTLNLTSLQSGLLMGVYSLLGILIGLFCINLLKKYNPRNLIIVANFLTLSGLVISLCFKTYNSLFFGRILSGTGMTLLTIISPSLVSKIFREDYRSSKFLGIYATGMPIATIVAFYLLPILERASNPFFFLKIGVILSTIAFTFSIIPKWEYEERKEVKNIKQKFSLRYVIPLSLVWLLFNAGTLSFITFSYTFAVNNKSLPHLLASTIGSATMIGGLVLGTFIGALLDRRKSLIVCLIVAGCFLVGLGYILFYFSSFYLLTFLLLAIGGGIVPTSVFSFPHLFNLEPLENTFGVIAAFLSIGSFMGPFLVGALMNRSYESCAFILMAFFMFLGSIIGIFCLRQAQKEKA